MRSYLGYGFVLLLLAIRPLGAMGMMKIPVKQTYQYSAQVMRIVDGDTIYVADKNGLKHKLRLANIDAPELSQAYGKASKESLGRLAYKEVWVKVNYLDKFHREVADVFLKQEDVNLQQVKGGQAWLFTRYAQENLKPERLQQYTEAERSARFQKKGLWKNPSAVPPWIFRKKADVRAF
ncbi:MAG: thermonuclease family protein [Neisseriaceae bacterium]